MIEDTKGFCLLNPHTPHLSCDGGIIGTGKGEAIQWLQQYFGISRNETVVFGDGWNDLSMFDQAGTSIAMGNAVLELKEKATWISADFLEGGVVQGLVKAGLLNVEEIQSRMSDQR